MDILDCSVKKEGGKERTKKKEGMEGLRDAGVAGPRL